MQFLCHSHRLHLSENPAELLPAWRRICKQGHEALHEGDWRRAAILFGNAWEMSDILLEQNPGPSEQRRYVDTATEMMRALADGQQRLHCRQLLARVLGRLERETQIYCSQAALSILREFAFGNPEAATRRLQERSPVISQRPAYLH